MKETEQEQWARTKARELQKCFTPDRQLIGAGLAEFVRLTSKAVLDPQILAVAGPEEVRRIGFFVVQFAIQGPDSPIGG